MFVEISSLLGIPVYDLRLSEWTQVHPLSWVVFQVTPVPVVLVVVVDLRLIGKLWTLQLRVVPVFVALTLRSVSGL